MFSKAVAAAACGLPAALMIRWLREKGAASSETSASVANKIVPNHFELLWFAPTGRCSTAASFGSNVPPAPCANQDQSML